MKIIVTQERAFKSSMERHGQAWSRDDDAALRVMVGHHDHAERIAEVLQRSVPAVLKRWEFIGPLPDDLYPTAYDENGHFDPASNRPLSEQFGSPMKLTRWARPSKVFPNRWPNTCCVCLRLIPKHEQVHFVATDKLAHAECF
ncbi:MAG: hypothetical protein KKA97_09160 [Actinobacteria bacterium]|nr:hypothetical protein [Actinomycetota bacterium]